MSDWLFTSTLPELGGLLLIVLLASVIRGAIGFGFSALVVASSSFWLPPVAVVALVVLLEVAASLLMFRGIRGDIDYRLLLPLTLGGLPGALIGVTILANIQPFWLQLLMGSYLTIIVLVSLLDLKFAPDPARIRLSGVGAIAGFYNGLAGMGGIFIATFLNGARMSVKNIRATLVVYFFLSEATFLIGAYLNDVYTPDIFFTALATSVPMVIGIQLGTHFFNRLPEMLLRKLVLVVLLIVSVLGLLKYL